MNYHLKTRPGSVKGIHVYILVPHTFDYITTSFFDVMMSMETKYQYSVLRNNMLPLERNRTHSVEIALQDPSVTHCLFIDTDIVPPVRNFLDIMVSYDQDILGLLCTKKCPPYEPILYKKDAPQEEVLNNFWVKYPKGLVEVDAVGTGCLLVKRQVFEAMKKPYFKFYGSYETNTFQSEDVYFLENAKKLGFKCFVDTMHPCTHHTPMGMGVNDFHRATNYKYEVK